MSEECGGSVSDDATRTSAEHISILAHVESYPLATIIIEAGGFDILDFNALAARMLTLTRRTTTAHDLRDFVSDVDRTRLLDVRERLDAAEQSRSGPIAMQMLLMRADSTPITCWVHLGRTTIAGRRLTIACLALVDSARTEIDLWRIQAERDELTGMLRRGPFMAHVDDWVDTVGNVVIIFVDVDKLKSINDTHGHAAGDHVLRIIADRLIACLPRDFLTCRFAGDEFVAASRAEAESGDTEIAATVRSAVSSQPIRWGGIDLACSVSVGVARQNQGDSITSVMARADAAMYLGKNATTDDGEPASGSIDRGQVDRAIGILMATRNFTAEAAIAYLTHAASLERSSAHRVAARILAAVDEQRPQ